MSIILFFGDTYCQMVNYMLESLHHCMTLLSTVCHQYLVFGWNGAWNIIVILFNMVRREQGEVEGELDLGDGGNLNLRPDTIEYNLHRLSIYRNDRNVMYKNPLYIEKQNICNNGRTKRNRGKNNHKLLTWIVSFFVLLLFSMYVLFIALRIGFTRDNNDQK